MEEKKVDALNGELSEQDVVSENEKLSNENLEDISSGTGVLAEENNKTRAALQLDGESLAKEVGDRYKNIEKDVKDAVNYYKDGSNYYKEGK